MPGFYTGAYETTCNSVISCIGSDIFNFGQKYFTDFVSTLKYMVYDKALDSHVLGFSVWLVIFMLFLSFIVGFIFFNRNR